MTHTAVLGDSDMVVVEDRHCFFNGMFTVALWPDLMVVHHGPGLTREQAQAYAIGLAADRGTFAWDLTFALPERLVATGRTPDGPLSHALTTAGAATIKKGALPDQSGLDEEAAAVEIARQAIRAGGTEGLTSDAQRQKLVRAVAQDLGDHPGPEDRLAKLEAQTQVLAEAVIAIAEPSAAVAPAIQAVKIEM